jgi:Spy/CpxP family protein refolding chaperone
MSVRSSRAAVPLILACALSLSAAARAQDTPHMASMNVAISPEQVQQIVSDRLLQDGITAGLQSLHQELRLTASQEPRWRDFILASNAKPVGTILATVSNDDATPLGQAQANLTMQREQLDVEARRVKAMARLYRALSDEQRAVFDNGFAMIGSLSVSTQPMLRRTAD